MQVISPESHISLPLSDLSQLPPAQRDTEALRLAREEALRPFDLSTGPLIRARLLRLSPAEHILLLSMHHIVSDGWSMGVFVGEMAALYEAYAAGAESTLKELNIQYGDFAVWQREWLQGEVLEQQLAYWRKQLAGVPPVVELPTDYSRPEVKTFNGAAMSLNLSRSLSEELKTLSRKEGVTLFMSLLAAFQVLLRRYSGQEDIAVGTPVAHRTRAETEELIGFFVNTLVLRTELSGNPTFRELVQRVKETALGAYAHQDVPFEKLVEELAPERNLSVTPLFQVMFAMQNTPSPEIRLKDLQLSLLETERETAKFDITLVMWETAEGLEGSLEYNTDLYEGATMQRLLRHFQTLLEGVAADPSARIADLPLLTASEQQQLEDRRIEFRGRADEQVKIRGSAPEASPPAPAASYLAPTTELERRIAEIWQDVLGVERIGMHDNFFELGGNSLALVLMNVRLNETLGQEMSIIELFKHPTITLLAAYIGQIQDKTFVDTSNRRRAAERREALKERSRPRRQH